MRNLLLSDFRSLNRLTWMVFCLVLFSLNLPLRSAVAEFQAGAAVSDITPAQGVSLDGSISKNGPVESIHDPLHARALVLDDGNLRLAIVVCDLCMIGRDVVDQAKAKIAAQSEIDE